MKLERWLTAGVVGSVLLFAGSQGLAQAPPDPRPSGASSTVQGGASPDRNRDADDEKLNLTPEQKNQIKQIRQNERSQIESIRNDSSLTPEQKQRQIREIRRGSNKQINALLTPEQRKIRHERRAEHRGHHRHHRHARTNAPSPNRLL